MVYLAMVNRCLLLFVELLPPCLERTDNDLFILAAPMDSNSDLLSLTMGLLRTNVKQQKGGI